MKAFISYSHRDENYLERLKVHLAQMKRENMIDEWTDKEIHAGSSLENEINGALASSQIFLALVSPDYLASNYCFEKEFEAALQLQEEGELIIVPIIVEHCEWQKTPFGKLKAIPKDGKPISDYTNPNNAFLTVVDELRRLIETKPQVYISDDKPSNEVAVPSSKRNYKVKKTFSEVDKVNFIEASFKYILAYFKSSVDEINDVENIQARFLKQDNSSFSCLISNRANVKDSYLAVSLVNKGQTHFGDLQYAFSDRVNESSIHLDKLFNIGFDEYELFWISHNAYGFQRQRDEVQLTAVGVAEIIWNNFIEQVGIS
ncbi:toll/interleukin-1 receptor domain-containing protein [Pedobacter lithocola]|uniref:Toll/interleukin-1 receptor domain-containing protein n=1 Tax=Pedobacter lithocola TaxID=1908239 RepID=A0ABV8PCE2_9SPHI